MVWSYYPQKQNRRRPKFENNSASDSDSVRKRNKNSVGKLDFRCPYDEHSSHVIEDTTGEIDSSEESVRRIISWRTTLLDVYSVKITVKDRNKFPGSSFRIHGAIRVVEPDSTPGGRDLDIFFYKVKRDDPLYIHLDRDGSATLPLSGPSKTLPIARDCIGIAVALKLNDEDVYLPPPGDNLYMKEESSYVFEDENFVQSITWFQQPCCLTIYDRVESRLAWEPYEYGEEAENSFIPVDVVVDYAIFVKAVGAEVHVSILGEGVEKVYGCIRACPCFFDKAVVLFDKEQQTDAVPVQFQSIKLLRSLVAVPTDASLLIEAQLYDQCGNLLVDQTSFFRVGRSYNTVGAVKFEVRWKFFTMY